MKSRFESVVNNWLDSSIVSNNGILYHKNNEKELLEYTYSDYCEDFYFKIKNEIIKKGNSIQDEEEFKDRVIYLLYKYSQHELPGRNAR